MLHSMRKAFRGELLEVLVDAEAAVGQPAKWLLLALQSLHENIIRDIRSKEYDKPTPIQAQGIPVGMSGRYTTGLLPSCVAAPLDAILLVSQA